MRLTIADIARRANVSKATVSRVLNGKPDVDPATARRIMALVDELGYAPNSSALALAKGRANCLGMLVPSLTWPWMLEILRGVAEAVEPTRHALMLYTMSRGDESLRSFTTQVIRAQTVDGLAVIVPPGLLEYLTDLYHKGLPVVLIDDRGYNPGFPSVTTTNRAGATDATHHLLSLGRRRIAMITGPMGYGCNRDRLAGYRQALEEAGLAFDPALVVEGDFTEAGGAAAAAALLAGGSFFDGLFAANDLMAIGAMRALRQAGRWVPDDVAIVGFDDIPSAAHTDPPLTTVRQPLYEMGRTAAQMLLANLQGEPLPASPVQLPTSLVVRGSTVPN